MLYKDLKEIPIPAFGYCSKTDGRVYEFIEEEGKPLRQCSRRSIGKATSTTTMVPNSNFMTYHADLWKEYYGDKDILPSKVSLNAGLYACTLAIASNSGLYDALIETFGTTTANGALDYSMYQMSTHSNVSMTYQEHMDRYIQFSSNSYDDTWWSNFFNTKLDKNKRELFLNQWIELCKKKGITSVYLSIDGSNFDCNAKKCELAEPGKAKSGHDNTDLIGVITVVDANTGLPIYYYEFNGGKVDSKSIIKVIMVMKNHGVNVMGIILDRGLCYNNVLEEIGDDYDYVLMLRSDTYGHLEMLEEYLDTIRWNVNYMICDKNESKVLFAIEKKKKLFKSNDREAYINLYFDGVNASERSQALLLKICTTMNDLQKKIDSNCPNIHVPADVKKYISIEISNGKATVVLNKEQCQKDINTKGYYSIATSSPIGTSETYRIYHLRDASETGYSILKTQLGEHVLRTHSTDSIEAKMFIGFIASIIRCYFMNACKDLSMDTNQMINEISRLQFMSNESGVYSYVQDASVRHKRLLATVGVTTYIMQQLAVDHNNRKDPISPLIRKLPIETQPEYQRRKRGGRKKGCLNKKTLEKIAQEQKSMKKKEQQLACQTTEQATQSTTTQVTTEQAIQTATQVTTPQTTTEQAIQTAKQVTTPQATTEQAIQTAKQVTTPQATTEQAIQTTTQVTTPQAATEQAIQTATTQVTTETTATKVTTQAIIEVTDQTTEKKHAGRPKGSLNKSTIQKLQREQENKKRGRPKGSLNKSTIQKLQKKQENKKRGRPKGSLNKSTILKLQKEQENKKRGRPKGSRGKKFTSILKTHKIGRPLGSKNKKTLARLEAEKMSKSENPKK